MARAGGTCGGGHGTIAGKRGAEEGAARCPPDIQADPGSQGRVCAIGTLPFSSIIVSLGTARMKLVGDIVKQKNKLGEE